MPKFPPRIAPTLAALTLALAGCDDGTVITRVDRYPAFDSSQIIHMDAGGIPAEIHGLPFPGVDPDEVAARLRLPAGFAQGFRFRAVAPGSGAEGRLVLVFNGTEAPNGVRDCKRGAEAPTEPPRDVGFALMATFCRGAAMLAGGHLEARTTRADDPQEFSRVMQTLLFNIIGPTGGPP